MIAAWPQTLSACAANGPRFVPRERLVDFGLEWVDEFIARVRPFIFVRAEDGLLIKRPNQAQKLNATGVRVLGALLEGVPLAKLLDQVGRDPVKARQIGLFLCEIKRFLEGTLTEANASQAVAFQPLPLNFSLLPVLSEIAVTYRCNLACRFCYAGCNRDGPTSPDRPEMNAEQIRAVLDRIWRDAQVPSVSFTGGEPTLRSELPELIAHAKHLGLRVNLVSNGTLVSQTYALRLAEAGLDSAQISLEGVCAETHDRITGGTGSFAKSVAAVRHLANAGIRVHTNTTITRANLAECRLFPRFAKEQLGRDRFSMNLVIPTGSALGARDLIVRYCEIGPILETIQRESRRHSVEFMWYSPTPLCLFNPISKGLGNKGCAACDGLLSIAPDGAVLPCASCADPVGNLLAEPFAQIWQSTRARRYRAKELAHPQCQACEHFAVCHGACPLYWQALGFAELEEPQSLKPNRLEGT